VILIERAPSPGPLDDFDRSARPRPDSDAPQARSPAATNIATNQKLDPHKSLYF
jgi:hypothetical protein